MLIEMNLFLSFRRFQSWSGAMLIVASLLLTQAPSRSQAVLPKAVAPIPVKVVVVTAFETGDDEGDAPGELQLWVERLGLTRRYPLPAERAARGNDEGVLALVTGVGTARAAASVMALGLDARFDLSKAYWLVAGIAGGDPADTTLGSAVWAGWVVDADLAYELDAREMPADWPTGYLPWGKTRPYQQPANNRGETFRLNAGLQNWAFELTREMKLADNPRMEAYRARFRGSANAQKPPSVMKGDDLSGSTFWHGRMLNRRANDWVSYWSGGNGNYVTTAMEDTGTLQALTFLAKAKRVDLDRVMVLRTVSDFDSPPPDMTAAESLVRGRNGATFAVGEALEAAQSVGGRVVAEMMKNWDKYRDAPPKP